MNTQRTVILISIIFLFLILSGNLIYRQTQFTKNNYPAGDIPQTVMDQLLPKTVPIDSIRPPALRVSDPIRYNSPTSTVSIIEYGDFQCDYCRQMTPELESLAAAYKGRVRFVWRDLPLEDQHPNALQAAMFARCAGQQGKYWEAHDVLMQATSLGAAMRDTIASQLGLDRQLLTACEQNPSITATIRQDAEEARADGIQSTPFIFIGTKPFEGVTNIETLRQSLEMFLAAP